MIDRKPLIAFTIGAAFVITSLYSFSGDRAVAQTGADQPHMQAALAALTAARSQLQAAAHNKAGHRAAALDHVNAAIAEVQAGMAAAY
jgi:hypothetical protein